MQGHPTPGTVNLDADFSAIYANTVGFLSSYSLHEFPFFQSTRVITLTISQTPQTTALSAGPANNPT